MHPPLTLLLALALLSALSCRGPVGIAQAMGTSGWLQVDRPGTPPPQSYPERFTRVPLAGVHPGCGALRLSSEGPVVVLVPGIQGDGEEFIGAVPLIIESHPAGVFMVRWMAFERLGAMTDRLAQGLSRLLACRPQQEVVVLAHSAGGVLVSEAAAKVQVPPQSPDDALKVITVAAPLAGTMRRVRKADGSAESRFILDLGTHFTRYPPPPRGVKAVHLRSQFPADGVMEPDGDFIPNDPEIGIPGAAQIDLPAHLDHVAAFLYAAEQLADGGWRAWFQRTAHPGR